MDQLSLLNLLSNSTKRLASLHEELGHPPDRLEDAIQSLHNVLHAAVQGQLDQVQGEVDDARAQLANGERRVRRLKVVLGEEPSGSSGSQTTATSSASSSSMTRSASTRKASGSASAETKEPPLLPRVQAVNSEANRLQTLYNSRKSQAEKLTAQLDSFRPILGDFVPQISTEYDRDGDGDELAIIPSHHLVQLSANIDKCGCELTHRSEQLQELLFDILGLWSELCLPPDEHSADEGQPSFDALILRHLDLKPLFEYIGDDEHGQAMHEFQGNFQGLGVAAQDDPSSRPDTPTRRGGGSGGGGHDASLRSERSADTHFPPHILVPSPHNISRATGKQAWLREEKQRREDRIQSLYDELLELWLKFGVSSEEMDDFVMNNSGSTLAVVEAYEAELSKMQELKRTHMVYFITQVRESMDALWSQLRTSNEEKEMTFPEYFSPLDAEADASEMDALLARHEEYMVQLEGEIETKLPILKIVTRYYDVLDEERQLEESAKDSTRLMRGVRGDPGRLLREEKMRKKVKIQKPKLEQELLKAIPAWEAENNRAFTIDGERYYEKIQALAEASAPRKRTRTVSTMSSASGGATATAAAAQTPSASSHAPLQHSSTHTNRMGATPMRGGGGAAASGVKRAKVAGAGTPATASRNGAATGTLRAKVAPTATPHSQQQQRPPSQMQPPRSASRLASTSKIPMPAAAAAGSSSPTRAGAADNPFVSRGGGAATNKTNASQSSSAASASRRPPISSSSHAATAKRVSTEGYQATHVFRPRPSTTGGGGGPSTRPPSQPSQAPPTPALPRNMSGASIASDATTLHYAGPSIRHDQVAYAQAIPNATDRLPRKSVNRAGTATTRRGPSMSLEGALASLAAAGYARPKPPKGFAGGGAGVTGGGMERSASIRQISGDGAAPPDGYDDVDDEVPRSGGNWARLDEEDGEGEGDGDGDGVGEDLAAGADEMEVF